MSVIEFVLFNILRNLDKFKIIEEKHFEIDRNLNYEK